MNAKTLFECAVCGSKVFEYKSQVGKNFYCSRACYAESLRNKVPHNKGKKVIVYKPCKQCGKVIQGAPSLVSRRKYCSMACAASAITSTDAAKSLSRFVEVDGCWLWVGSLRGGYGRVRFNGKLVEAHRLSYEHHVGKIPDGLVIDHLCRNRSCINPEHLEVVTEAENIRRGNQGSPEAMEKHWKTRRTRRVVNS
jgi:hypothetical protein